MPAFWGLEAVPEGKSFESFGAGGGQSQESIRVTIVVKGKGNCMKPPFSPAFSFFLILGISFPVPFGSISEIGTDGGLWKSKLALNLDREGTFPN